LKAHRTFDKAKRNVKSGIVQPCSRGWNPVQMPSGFVPAGTPAARALAGKQAVMRPVAARREAIWQAALLRRIGKFDSFSGRISLTSGFLKRKLQKIASGLLPVSTFWANCRCPFVKS
jgi:hypothetical protein